MSIKNSFLAIAVAVIGLLAAIFYLMTLEVQNQGALAEAEARRYASNKLSDELRQSSDDLTRMARTYVVTGDPVYEEYFWRILAIRDGDAPRPENYGDIYWDLLTATGEKPGPDGEPVALQTLMSRMHFTTEEFAKLRESQDNSDALVALEERAMAAVKGLYEDADGHYTVRGEADMALARELLHGPAYHHAKAGIMAPIAEFTTMVENRTSREIDILRARADLLMRNTLGLIGLVVGLLVLGFFLLQRRVTRPVVELAAAANRAENGDYSARVEVKSKNEIGALAGAFNHMATAIESDITDRKLANEELKKVSQAVESSPASVVITDIDGTIEYVNPKFTTVTGYTSAEVIGKNPRVLNSGKQTP